MKSLTENRKCGAKKTGRLILDRRKGESLLIFDPNDGAFHPIAITLIRAHGSRASIMVEASRHLTVTRSEIAKNRSTAASELAKELAT